MTWGPSTHLRALAMDAIASGADVANKRGAVSRAELNCFYYAIKHYIDFNGGGIDWQFENYAASKMLRDYFIQLGEAWHTSWDGQKFDNETYIDMLISKLYRMGWKGDGINDYR